MNMKKILLFLICFLFSLNAYASVQFDIDNNEIKKIRTLFTDFTYVSENKDLSKDVQENSALIQPSVPQEERDNARILVENIIMKIKQDLKTTNLFDIMVEGENWKFWEGYNKTENKDEDDMENFILKKYKNVEVDAILVGSYEINKKGSIEIKIRLWDVLDERQLFGKYYIAKKNNWSRIGHVIADQIYASLTGEITGHFDSKIVYIAEIGDPKNRKKRLALVDFDGENLNYLDTQNNLVITPVFSQDDKNTIFYVEYKNRMPAKIYQRNLLDNIVSVVGDFKEMTFSPSYHPAEEQKMLFSAAKKGITDIYEINLRNGKSKRLTNTSFIDTTPYYSPDGEKIVFCSDRSGSQKLYVMDVDGTNVNRISLARGEYSKPSWSPDGRLIAFVKVRKGEFFVGVMSPGGENERMLISAYLVEGVKWSPNGRYLMYSKQLGAYGDKSIPYLYVMDILTGYEYKISTPLKEGATDPDWISK